STALSSSLAAGLAPTVLTAREKSGTKNPIIGQGEHRYECFHNWGTLPRGMKWQTTHGVCVDAEGLIYIKQQGLGRDPVDCVHVFDAMGKHVRSFGKEFHGGGHGIDLRQEDGKEYLYLTDIAHGGVVVKADLQGEAVWTKKGPPPEANYDKKRYSPTNVAFAPDGGFYVGDGYGSNLIHQFDKAGKHVRSFGETGKGKGQLQTPHGIWLDDRPGREPALVVADRANKRLQYFSLDGKHLSFVEGLLFPAHCETRGDVLLVPDLHARVTLFGKDNKVLAQLGDDTEWRKRVLDGFKMRQTPEKCDPGKFIHPHDACFDKNGNIFVVEWVATGRVTLLKKLS
ncbi:MAG: peptidase, partial [Gemmataceae bacterium]